jgi:hypothetical protein
MTNELEEFEVAQEVETPEVQIPEKFQGKSVEDIVKSYTELEKLHGRQSREYGELRKLADDLVMRSMQPATPATPEEPVDIYTDPDKYIAKAIESNPRLQQIEAAAVSAKRTELLTELQNKYGKVDEIVSDPDFQDWVSKSRVRTELFVRADKGLDKDAALELLDTWTERKMITKTKEARDMQEERLGQDISAAGSVKGNSGVSEGSKKVYRRADIIRLQITDPKRYQQLMPEIRQAYSEGRVK